MIACTPVAPPGILIGSTFVACGQTWIYNGPAGIVRAPTNAEIRASLMRAWDRYCRSYYRGHPKAMRVCFKIGRTHP